MVVFEDAGDGDGLGKGKPGRKPGSAETACTVNEIGKLPEQACIPEIRLTAVVLVLEKRTVNLRTNRREIAEARCERICSCVSVDTSSDNPSVIIKSFTSSIDKLICISASVDAVASMAIVWPPQSS